MSKTTLYVAFLEQWYDDYKRAEASSEPIGIFTSKLTAYRAAWKIEILENCYFRSLDNIKGNPYLEQLRKLDEIQEDELEALIPKMEKDREALLGKGEFTIQSSGSRCTVKELVVDQVNTDRKKYRKFQRKYLEAVDPEAAKQLKVDEEDEEDDDEEE